MIIIHKFSLHGERTEVINLSCQPQLGNIRIKVAIYLFQSRERSEKA